MLISPRVVWDCDLVTQEGRRLCFALAQHVHSSFSNSSYQNIIQKGRFLLWGRRPLVMVGAVLPFPHLTWEKPSSEAMTGA